MEDIKYLIKGETPDWVSTDSQRSEYMIIAEQFKKFIMVFIGVSALVYFSPATVRKIPLLGKYLGKRKTSLFVGLAVLALYFASVRKKVLEVKG